MTPYEAAMKRIELEADMALNLKFMWTFAKAGKFAVAMWCQFEYLLARDEWEESRWDTAVAGQYWPMWDATNGKRKSIYD